MTGIDQATAYRPAPARTVTPWVFPELEVPLAPPGDGAAHVAPDRRRETPASLVDPLPTRAARRTGRRSSDASTHPDELDPWVDAEPGLLSGRGRHRAPGPADDDLPVSERLRASSTDFEQRATRMPAPAPADEVPDAFLSAGGRRARRAADPAAAAQVEQSAGDALSELLAAAAALGIGGAPAPGAPAGSATIEPRVITAVLPVLTGPTPILRSEAHLTRREARLAARAEQDRRDALLGETAAAPASAVEPVVEPAEAALAPSDATESDDPLAELLAAASADDGPAPLPAGRAPASAVPPMPSGPASGQPGAAYPPFDDAVLDDLSIDDLGIDDLGIDDLGIDDPALPGPAAVGPRRAVPVQVAAAPAADAHPYAGFAFRDVPSAPVAATTHPAEEDATPRLSTSAGASASGALDDALLDPGTTGLDPTDEFDRHLLDAARVLAQLTSADDVPELASTREDERRRSSARPSGPSRLLLGAVIGAVAAVIAVVGVAAVTLAGSEQRATLTTESSVVQQQDDLGTLPVDEAQDAGQPLGG